MVSSCISDSTLVMLAVNVLFLHRPVYTMQKDKIDKAWTTVMGMLSKYSKMVSDKIPKYVEAVKKN